MELLLMNTSNHFSTDMQTNMQKRLINCLDIDCKKGEGNTMGNGTHRQRQNFDSS
ncbi:hypothetical protein X777_14595 [Ooceraea biroi]|uniref:Uncharacterized protein n=1 Tax=Ooceraea biroi TaxID=2015173 RepID=A0A026WZK1_OOCBI|nr:hypothetical protein X777_14595 [Ooceraea biroi]